MTHDDEATAAPAVGTPVERPVGRLVPERTVASIPDADLLRRVVRHVVRSRPRRKEFAWAAVSEAFALGSTFAMQLCRRFDLDPDTGADTKSASQRMREAGFTRRPSAKSLPSDE